MASISVVTRPSKRGDGKLPLYLRIHHKNKTRYLSLRVHVYKTHWNDSRSEVRRSHRSHLELNRFLVRVRRTGEEVLYEMMREGIPFRSDLIKNLIEERLFPEEEEEVEVRCFIAYSEKLLETWRGRWAYQTYLAYCTAVRKLEDFAGRPLPFEDVTPDFCRHLHNYIATKLGNSLNTQHKNLSTLKGFYRQAMEDGVIEWGRNPFDVLTLRKEVGDKRKLTTEELRRLKDVPLEEDSLLADVRRWFFFAFYAGGMRFSDVAELKRKHVTRNRDEIRVRYRMGKTKDMHGVLLVDEAVTILDYYDWEEKEGGSASFPSSTATTLQLRRVGGGQSSPAMPW